MIWFVMPLHVLFDTALSPVHCDSILIDGRLVNKVLVGYGKHAPQIPVVQSIVSLTSSLRGQLVKCFTTY